MWNKETEEQRKKREFEIYQKWVEFGKTAKEHTQKEERKYASDPVYRKQKDERTERQKKTIYWIFIIMLISSFFKCCIEPLYKHDNDPEKTEYEINRRLRLN